MRSSTTTDDFIPERCDITGEATTVGGLGGPKQLSPHTQHPEPSHTFLLETPARAPIWRGQAARSRAPARRATTGGGRKMTGAKAYGNAMEAAGAAMKFAMM
ncbi:MAG: hypothetical protein AMXMBFR56_31490 [Polyangiaceae bacterium]